jgi:hypothetical protein
MRLPFFFVDYSQNGNKKFGAEATCLTWKKALSEQYANE